MKTNDRVIALIKFYEGIKDGDPTTPALDPYICPSGYVTQGWGHVLLDENGQMLKGASGMEKAKKLYKPITMAQAEDLLRRDLLKYEMAVNTALIGSDATENEFSAMVSLTMNIGIGNFNNSSVLRYHKAGVRTSTTAPETLRLILNNVGAKAQNMALNAPDAFLLWKMGGGVILPGLQERRRAERLIYLEK